MNATSEPSLAIFDNRLAWNVPAVLDAPYNPHCGPLGVTVSIDATTGAVLGDEAPTGGNLGGTLPQPFCI